MNKEECMIKSTRFQPTIREELVDAQTNIGLIGVYNRGQSDMYDYLMDKFTKLYARHIGIDYAKPNMYMLMDFYNEFKHMVMIKEDNTLEEELDNIMK